MEEVLKQAVKAYILGLADDELILGHRDSEWCGHAPILEEDIAFANIALDEIGHAGLWYTLYSELAGEDKDEYPDRLVYFREPNEYRNIQMVELPNGDFAFSMLRQYLFDMLEMVRLGRLSQSKYQPLADIAAKVRKEEIYHARHCKAWVRRLGLGTEESRRRLQVALDALWPFVLQPFISVEGEEGLVEAGYVPASQDLKTDWEAEVVPFLKESGLAIPEVPQLDMDRSRHTPHLKILLYEMQTLPRSEPEAKW
jgi:ring-1,2-phenylacetyl-CoA epoxidase subunit PaaC